MAILPFLNGISCGIAYNKGSTTALAAGLKYQLIFSKKKQIPAHFLVRLMPKPERLLDTLKGKCWRYSIPSFAF